MLFSAFFLMALGWYLGVPWVVIIGKTIVGLWVSYWVILMVMALARAFVFPPIQAMIHLMSEASRGSVYLFRWWNNTQATGTGPSTRGYVPGVFRINTGIYRIAYTDIESLDQVRTGRMDEAHQIIQDFFDHPNRAIEIIRIDHDSEGIDRVQVRSHEFDIGRTLVHYGYARCAPHAPEAYTQSEQDAQSRMRGVWAPNGAPLAPIQSLFSR